MAKKKDGYERLGRFLANFDMERFGPGRELWEDFANTLREAFPNTPPKLTKQERADRKFLKEHESPKFNARSSHTFQEWSDAGYRIVKGSHSKSRNKENQALFLPSQVILSGDRVAARWDDLSTSRDRDDYEMEMFGSESDFF